MRILPTKEKIELYERLEPYTYFDNLEYKLKEDVPESAKKDWELRKRMIEEEKKIRLQEYLMG